ncbi:MAG: prepilin-type N-terminal cleavage/methylation domain-containing protein [Holosporales bacterium]|jgi:prepilin-type N-terminal cleavage/methylation domain-containing protein|nr:prepilin-type N-terminal cleavage/methylation domain-containing protein [Holosporales bacterium]
MYKINKKKIAGFSLIEISIVLLIAGIMLGSVLKGRDLIEQARIRSVVYTFSQIQTGIFMYISDHGGEDVLNPPTLIWEKLNEEFLLPTAEAPSSKIGGVFAIRRINNLNYLSLVSKEESAFLTIAQAKSIYAQLTESKERNQNVVVQNSTGNIVDMQKENSKTEKYIVSLLLQA